MKDRKILFAAIRPRAFSTGPISTFYTSPITKELLCLTIDHLFLDSSALCKVYKKEPLALKTKLKSPRYGFSPYELKRITKDDDKFPRNAIVLRRRERFFVKNEEGDIIIAFALSFHIYHRCIPFLNKKFFFCPLGKKDFNLEVGSWGPVHSIFLFDVHTIIDEVDLKDLKCFLHPLLKFSADP
jgi:hypothetical protein